MTKEREDSTGEIKQKPDMVNHPRHYNEHPSGLEAYEVLQHFNFLVGNGLKYLWRADLKHESPNEDLLKAHWYFKRELRRLEAGRWSKGWARWLSGRVAGSLSTLLGKVLDKLPWHVLRDRTEGSRDDRAHDIREVVELLEKEFERRGVAFKTIEQDEEEEQEKDDE